MIDQILLDTTVASQEVRDKLLGKRCENMMGTVRRLCRNVKRWRNAAMALRWTAAGMMEAAKGFRRLEAYRLLPILRAALVAHATEHVATKEIEPRTDAA